MAPIIPLLALAGAGFLLLRGKGAPADSPLPDESRGVSGVDSAALADIVGSIASGPEAMRRTARDLRARGLIQQAEALEQAADAIEHAVELVPEPPTGSRPVEDAPRPPRDAQPVEPPLAAEPEPVIDVPAPPNDAVEITPIDIPEPPARDPLAVAIPSGVDALVEDYARMVYASAPRGPVKDLELSDRFKRTLGVRGDKKFYGSGPAKALIGKGVIPPTPWDWQQSNVSADKQNYRSNLAEARRNDPARAEAWQAAIDAV